MSIKRINIPIKLMNKEATVPKQAHYGDAGYDLKATSCERIGLFKYKYGTGIAIQIPYGYEVTLRPRSSIFKAGMLFSSSPSTIDSGYRGEIFAVFWKIPFIGKRYKVGDRICQMLVKPVIEADFEEKDKLSESERGENGYGSSGR